MTQVASLSKEQARVLIDGVKEHWGKFELGFQRIIKYSAWEVLGYTDFSDMFIKEGMGEYRLSAAVRKEIVQRIAQEHPEFSQRDLADVTGTSQATIRRDLSDIDKIFEPNDSTVDLVEESSPGTPVLEGEIVTPEVEEIVALSAWSQEESDLRTKVLDGETIVVSKRKEAGFDNLIEWARIQDLYVDITRNTKWGNPFEIPQDGTRGEVILNYEQHYLPYKPSLKSALKDLQGKVLVCWCSPKPCHGDVLARLAK